MQSVLFAILFVLIQGNPADVAANSGQGKGKFDQAISTLDLVRLATNGERILVSRVTDAVEARKKIQPHSRLVGGGTTGGMSRDGSWSQRANGKELISEIYFMKNRDKEGGYVQERILRIVLKENLAPRRFLNIVAGEKHNFHVRYRNADLGEYFFLQQSSNGELICHDVSKNGAFSRRVNSLEDLKIADPDFFSKVLVPRLEQSGLGNLLGFPNSQWGDDYLAMLRAQSASSKDEFKKLVLALDSDSFKEREQATNQILSEYGRWKFSILAATEEPGISVEANSRLTKILVEKLEKPEVLALKQQLKTFNEKSPTFLISLLRNRFDDEADRKLIVTRLEQLTSQKFGDSLERWEEWRKANEQDSARQSEITIDSKVKVPLVSGIKSYQVPGNIDAIRKGVAQLLPLKVEGGHLRLQRSKWTERIGGLDPQESLPELRELMKEKNIPLHWLNTGSYVIETMGPAQILFDKMSREARTSDRPPTVVPNKNKKVATMNRKFSRYGLSASLRMHSDAKNYKFNVGNFDEARVPKAEFFELSVTESKRHFRRVTVSDYPEKDLFIIQFEAKKRTRDARWSEAKFADVNVQLTQQGGENPGIKVLDVRGSEMFAARADSLSELQEANQEYFRDQLLPTLKCFGISW